MDAAGLGGPQDFQTALAWRGKAAAQNLTAATYSPGVLYEQGQSAPQRLRTAASWWSRKTARQGLDRAPDNLGMRHARGHGVPQDFAAAPRPARCSLRRRTGQRLQSRQGTARA